MNIIRQIDILESCWIKSGSDVLKAVSLLLFIFLSFFFSLKIEFLFRFILSKLKPAKLFWHLGKLLNEKLRQFWSVLICSFRLFLWSFERIKNKTKKKTTHFVSCSSTFVFMSIISRGTSCSSFSFSSPPGWPKPHMASYNWNDRLG